MMLVTAIVKPFALADVRAAFEQLDIAGMTVSEAPANVVEAMKKVGTQMAGEWKTTASPEAVAVLDQYMTGAKTN